MALHNPAEGMPVSNQQSATRTIGFFKGLWTGIVAVVAVGSMAYGGYNQYLNAELQESVVTLTATLGKSRDLNSQREKYIQRIEVESAKFTDTLNQVAVINTGGGIEQTAIDEMLASLRHQTMLIGSLRSAVGDNGEAVSLLAQYQMSLDGARVAVLSVRSNDPGELWPLFVAADGINQKSGAAFKGLRELPLSPPES